MNGGRKKREKGKERERERERKGDTIGLSVA
jgi:hypothetical protein